MQGSRFRGGGHEHREADCDDGVMPSAKGRVWHGEENRRGPGDL